MTQVMILIKNETYPIGGLIVDGHIYRGDNGEEVLQENILSLMEMPWVSISEEILGN